MNSTRLSATARQTRGSGEEARLAGAVMVGLGSLALGLDLSLWFLIAALNGERDQPEAKVLYRAFAIIAVVAVAYASTGWMVLRDSRWARRVGVAANGVLILTWTVLAFAWLLSGAPFDAAQAMVVLVAPLAGSTFLLIRIPLTWDRGRSPSQHSAASER